MFPLGPPNCYLGGIIVLVSDVNLKLTNNTKYLSLMLSTKSVQVVKSAMMSETKVDAFKYA